MKDAECVRLLQWALPRLGLRWSGYRRVRGQVCKRLGRRLRELGLDPESYRRYLDTHPQEWRRLDGFCRISISRFCRDRGVFDTLAHTVLPELGRRAAARGDALRAWSLGCASGEEPYSLLLAWYFGGPSRPQGRIEIIATDSDARLIGRARRACYRASSLKELPVPWRSRAFERKDDRYCLRREFVRQVSLFQQDVRETLPPGRFDLILCRNSVFTYFELPEQERVLARLAGKLAPGGVLVIGTHESLPPQAAGLRPLSPTGPFYQRALRP